MKLILTDPSIPDDLSICVIAKWDSLTEPERCWTLAFLTAQRLGTAGGVRALVDLFREHRWEFFWSSENEVGHIAGALFVTECARRGFEVEEMLRRYILDSPRWKWYRARLKAIDDHAVANRPEGIEVVDNRTRIPTTEAGR